MKEIYVDPTSYKVRVKDENGEDRPLEENTRLMEYLIYHIKKIYSEAWKACYEEIKVKDELLREKRALERFCRCNFGILDGTADISNGHIELEEVQCPLRGYCRQEFVICKPKLTLPMLQGEVAEDMICGKTKEEISEKRKLSFEKIKDIAYRLRRRFGFPSNITLLKFLRGTHQERRMQEFSFIRK